MSHNYAGNSSSFPLSLQIPDDGVDVPDFAVIMTPVEGLADRTAFLRAQTSPVDFAKQYTFTPIGGTVPTTVGSFDPINLKWMVGGFQSGPSRITFWTGRGNSNVTWTLLGGGASPYSGGTCQALCRGVEATTPANKYVYAAVIGGISVPGDNSVLVIDTNANTFTPTIPIAGTTDVLSMRLVSVPGAIVLAMGASGTPHTALFYTTNSGVTWTNTGLGIGAPISSWLLAQSIPGGGQILAIPQVAVALGTGYFESTNGTTWNTEAGFNSLPLLATELPATLCYGTDSFGVPCWVFTTFDSGVANQTKTYRSYDGLAWSSFANTIPAGLSFVSMAAVGETLVACVFESEPGRIVYSIDGGSTWLTVNAESNWTTTLGVVSSNNQFFVVTDVDFNFSKCLGSPGGFGAK